MAEFASISTRAVITWSLRISSATAWTEQSGSSIMRMTFRATCGIGLS